MVAMYHYMQHECNKLGEGWRRYVMIKRARLCAVAESREVRNGKRINGR